MEKTNTPSVASEPLNPTDIISVDQTAHLTGPQQLALEWLMGGGTLTDAAQFAGVCRQTVGRWLREDAHFSQAYASWREHVLASAQGRMLALADHALDNLSTAIRNDHNLQASQFLLKQLRHARIEVGEPVFFEEG